MEVQTTNWGPMVEKDYQTFLNFGRNNWDGWKRFHSTIYDQLEADGFIQKELWREQMPAAKSYVIAELQRKWAALKFRYGNDPLTLKSECNKVEREVEEYRMGKYDIKLQLLAKQWLVLRVFK